MRATFCEQKHNCFIRFYFFSLCSSIVNVSNDMVFTMNLMDSYIFRGGTSDTVFGPGAPWCGDLLLFFRLGTFSDSFLVSKDHCFSRTFRSGDQFSVHRHGKR